MRSIPLALIACGVIACSGSEPDASESNPPDTSTGIVPRVAVAIPDPLPPVAANRVQWDVDQVAELLREIGLQLAGPAAPVDASFLSARGYRWTAATPEGARAEIRAFFYGDAGAVAQDLAGLDTVRVAPRGTTLDWRVQARLITNNNLVSIILTDDIALREKIGKALTPIE